MQGFCLLKPRVVLPGKVASTKVEPYVCMLKLIQNTPCQLGASGASESGRAEV